MSDNASESIRFGADGLIPAIAQDVESGEVLMLAYVNREALELTRATGRAHYWSRSRGKLWRKGETSGNEQVVEEILINCEQNSLLLKVRQRGAVCHEGYDTCYFRALNDEDSLTIVRERIFDPATVYGSAAPANAGSDPLREATGLQFGAYLYLRDNDFERESGTSRRLRQDGEDLRARVADELAELAGVFTGEHRHSDGDFAADICLEASQVIYWILLEAIRAGATWEQLRPDRALATTDEGLQPTSVPKLLLAEAITWRRPAAELPDGVSIAHATLALVGQACRAGGVDPVAVVEADLADLRSREYLERYFAPMRAPIPSPSPTAVSDESCAPQPTRNRVMCGSEI